jgi:hypothetical protein
MLDRRTIGVRLNVNELEALRAVAEREDRPPRLQAARLIREALKRAGALPVNITDYNEAPPGEPCEVGAPT